MERSGDLIILLQSRTASKDLWEPELPHGALHVSDFALSWCWRLDPLRRLSPNTAHHVGVGKGLWCSLLGLHVECRRNWLGDSGMKRRGPARNNKILVADVSGNWAAITI